MRQMQSMHQWDRQFSRTPSQIWLRNIVVNPSLSLTLTKSSFHLKVIWEKVFPAIWKNDVFTVGHLFCSDFSNILFYVYEGFKLFKSRDVQFLSKNVYYKRPMCIFRSLDQHRWPKRDAVSKVTWNLSRDVTLFCRHSCKIKDYIAVIDLILHACKLLVRLFSIYFLFNI